MPWKAIPDAPRDWRSHVAGKRARFLVDESLGVEAARALRGRRWNAAYVGDLGLLGHSDEDVFAAAAREDRILLTHDRDFLNDRVFPPNRNPGLVVLPGGDGQQRPLVRALGDVLSVVGPFREVWRGSKIVIDEGGALSVSHRTWEGRMTRTRYRFARNGQAEEWQSE
jgi:predicted nuclease of predicted toxin-antitoxin system